MRPGETQTKDTGFALILALLLMSFVLLLMISSYTLISVETTNSRNALYRLQARESARFALMLAIGELQTHAGPDQRVTARADILGEGNYAPEAKYWTGVWDTTDPTAEPKWLVSGNKPDPASPNADSFRLVGPGTVESHIDQHVYAAKTYLNAGNDGTSQAYAWWISDEGIKTSLGIAPDDYSKAPNFILPESKNNLQLLTATTHGLEALFGNYDRNATNLATILGKSPSIEQILSSSSFEDESSWILSGEAPFHTLTLNSHGVLASVVPGDNAGLMSDLSLFPGLLGSALEDYLALGVENAKIQNDHAPELKRKRLSSDVIGLGAIGSLSDGEIAMPIAPVLSNFMMAFTVRNESSTDPNLYLRMRCFFEFWNPYTHSLNINPGSNDHHLEMDISGLPLVRAEKGGDSAIVDIQSVVGRDNADPNSPMTIQLIGFNLEEWLPGRSMHWTGINNLEVIENLAENNGRSPYVSTETKSKHWRANYRTLGGSDGIDTGVDIVTGSSELSLNVSGKSSSDIKLTVEVYASDGINRTLLSRLENIRYIEESTPPRTATNSSVNFGFHFILRGPHQSSDDPIYTRGRWLTDSDPRNVEPIFYEDWNLEYDPVSDAGSPYIPVINGIQPLGILSPTAISESEYSINFPIFRRLLDRSSGSSGALDKLWQDAPLFEIPRERVLSLASLQHLYFHNERPYKVGNSWGSEGKKNTLEWFDRYYFSGFVRSDDLTNYDQDRELSNPTLIAYDPSGLKDKFESWLSSLTTDKDKSKEPAESLMVEGRFNLNSTSIPAWKAFLSSLRLKDFEYLDYPEEDTSDLSTLKISETSRELTFTRYSHSLEETYEAPKTPLTEDSETVPPSAFYRLGARRLNDVQVESLAKAIVSKIKSRERPFFSIADFLSKLEDSDHSLIEEAIEEVLAPEGTQTWVHDWEVYGTELNESEYVHEIDYSSPGFLTQADVMTAIGPMISPRSDTFKIRAKGVTYDLQNKIVASAAIEAIVQRIPEIADFNKSRSIGEIRKFKVISLKWLAENDL